MGECLHIKEEIEITEHAAKKVTSYLDGNKAVQVSFEDACQKSYKSPINLYLHKEQALRKI